MNTHDNNVANGFALLLEPAAGVIAEGIIAVAGVVAGSVRFVAARLARPRSQDVPAADALLAPHAAIVVVPSMFLLGR